VGRTSLELQNEFPSECSTHAIKELSVSVAVDIVLHVTWIEMVEEVEHTESDASLELFVWNRQRNRSGDLEVDGIERREPQ